MKLLYELTSSQPSVDGKFHGGGYYGIVVFLEVAKRFLQQKTFELYVAYDSKKNLDPLVRQILNAKQVCFFDENQISVPDIILRYNVDRFYSPLPYNLPYAEKINCDFFGTIHGLRTLEKYADIESWRYENSFKLKIKRVVQYIGRKILSRSREYPHYQVLFENSRFRPITISEFSRNSISHFFPKMENVDIPIFFSPLIKSSENEQGLLPRCVQGKKYYLLLNANRWIKNSWRAICAFDTIPSEILNGNILVLTGIDDKSSLLKSVVHRDRFACVDFVERDVLNSLHKNAYALVYPSLNEGFGYPPIESMRWGIPVIASNVCSIPEVCGDAVMYFDPYDIEDIRKKMVKIMDKDVYMSFQQRSLRRYDEVSRKQMLDLESLISFLVK